jgi:phenylacetate-CoA ligase
LRRIIRFAVAQTPYYDRLFRRHGVGANDVRDPEQLRKLPLLSKHDVLQSQKELSSRAMPRGERMARATKSSGTTGRQVLVQHGFQSAFLSAALSQRHARSYGLDPMNIRVEIKAPFDIKRADDSASNPAGNLVRYPGGWRQLSRFFETGPGYGFNVSDKMDQQIEWLQKIQPHYAQSYPGIFEEWLYANQGRNPAPSLKALMGVGSQLTPSLEAKLNEGFGVPVHISYGLNEIGKVAMRCSAGRYHVHSELCLVEIVDESGTPCAPGEVGHLLVTGLKNFAMPLIRYDTGDLAEAGGGECACGRTLPFFAEIAGRYRRYAGLPEGTRDRVRVIRHAIENTPPEGIAFLRRYQVHQDRENRFTLRLKTVTPAPEAFLRAVHEAWAPLGGAPLTIVEMDEIATSPGGKELDFISDLQQDPATSPILVRR